MTKAFTLIILTLASFSCHAQVQGTWRIAPEANSLAVGQAMGDFSWWAINSDEVVQRSCYFDDLFVFRSDGTFSNMHGDETWLESWQGVTDDSCGPPVAPHDGSNPATWNYNDNNRTITLSGVGAYIGLPKVNNAGEIDDPANAVAEITYPVVFSGDRMTIDINYGGGFWHFVLEKVTGTTSTKDIIEDQFTFSPNPATNEIFVRSNDQVDAFIIRDITGKVLLERSNILLNESIDVSTLIEGLYILESRSEDQVTVKKMMVK